MSEMMISTVLGFLSGLGIGGGSLLFLWLTLIQGVAPMDARTMNLLFFLPSAAISIFLRRKERVGKLRIILPSAIAGCLTAAALSFVEIDTALLKKLFGGLLIATGLREVFYKPRR